MSDAEAREQERLVESKLGKERTQKIGEIGDELERNRAASKAAEKRYFDAKEDLDRARAKGGSRGTRAGGPSGRRPDRRWSRVTIRHPGQEPRSPAGC